MRLSDYLQIKAMSKAGFARLIGCTRQSVHLWIKGIEQPSFKYLEAIHEATNGKVTMEDFYINLKKKRK